MFSEDQRIRNLQEISLEILKQTAKVCDENNLTYYLCGGTLLGAIRHKGFIPWDDDIDIIMPRADYEKLIQIANDKLPNQYVLEHFSLVNNQEDIRTHHIQIVDKNIDLVRKWTIDEEVIHPWVDIFPLDGMPNNVLKRNLHYYHYRFWHNCMQLSMFEKNVNVQRERPVFERAVISVVSTLKIGKNWDKIDIMNKMEKIAKKYPFNHGKWACSFHGIYRKNEILEASIFKERIQVEFEDGVFYCMKEYDKDLKHYYGDYLIGDNKENKHPTNTIEKGNKD